MNIHAVVPYEPMGPGTGLGFVQFIPLIAAAVSAGASVYSSRYARQSQERLQKREQSFTERLRALDASAVADAASRAVGEVPTWAWVAGGLGLVGAVTLIATRSPARRRS